MTLQSIKARLRDSFPALGHNNFRYFWMGQCISLIGTWMQNTGQSWLVLQLTDSPLLLGLVGALQFTPMLLFSLFAGVIIDKFPKRKILLFTQTTLMLLALTLATLVATGQIRYWHILILATLLGFVNTLDMPTRQSFMIELVGKKDLTNAIALNSSIFNTARIVGPAIAGLTMAAFGAAICFYLNALSFLAVIYGLTRIKAEPVIKPKKPNTSIFTEIGEGLKHIYVNPVLLNTVFLVAIVGTFTMNYSVLLPTYTKFVLHQTETSYGFLTSALGVGSLIGALTVATKSKSGPKTALLFTYASIIAVLLMVIPLSGVYWLTALPLAITGFFNISFSANANSTMQINAQDEYRGRVMSVYALVFGGTTPIGSLITGTVTDNFGVRAAFISNGLMTLALIGLLLMIRSKTRKAVPQEVALAAK